MNLGNGILVEAISVPKTASDTAAAPSTDGVTDGAAWQREPASEEETEEKMERISADRQLVTVVGGIFIVLLSAFVFSRRPKGGPQYDNMPRPRAKADDPDGLPLPKPKKSSGIKTPLIGTSSKRAKVKPFRGELTQLPADTDDDDFPEVSTRLRQSAQLVWTRRATHARVVGWLCMRQRGGLQQHCMHWPSHCHQRLLGPFATEILLTRLHREFHRAFLLLFLIQQSPSKGKKGAAKGKAAKGKLSPSDDLDFDDGDVESPQLGSSRPSAPAKPAAKKAAKAKPAASKKKFGR